MSTSLILISIEFFVVANSEKSSKIIKIFEIFQNGPLNRVFKEFIFSKTTASQVGDFGLQAILEKMNSLITPLISGPFGKISNIFEKKWMICQSSSPHEIQLKLTLAPSTIRWPSADGRRPTQQVRFWGGSRVRQG